MVTHPHSTAILERNRIHRSISVSQLNINERFGTVCDWLIDRMVVRCGGGDDVRYPSITGTGSDEPFHSADGDGGQFRFTGEVEGGGETRWRGGGSCALVKKHALHATNFRILSFKVSCC